MMPVCSMFAQLKHKFLHKNITKEQSIDITVLTD